MKPKVGETMSTLEQTLTKTNAPATTKRVTKESLPTRFLKLLCSVRFGVMLLILLAGACLAGMLIMQQNVDGFDRYFEQITPAQRLVYAKLGLFDIYHSWYFNALLAALSLNIVLSSLDRFPKTWKFISKRNLTVPLHWLREQKQSADLVMNGSVDQVAAKVSNGMEAAGWKNPVTTMKSGRTYVFAESGVWNRFGAYAVHVGLLTIFIGGFMTSQFGTTGQLPLTPSKSTNLMYETVVNLDKTDQVTAKLPFDIECTDIQQKLIKKDGSISAMNTIDWFTRFKITDETGTHEAAVQMNRPFDYRGYRFFQASFVPVGRARNITLAAKPVNGGEVQQITIPRDGSTKLPDGTLVKFSEFRANFTMGAQGDDDTSGEYGNPGAVLQVAPPDAPAQTAYAFAPNVGNIPIANKPVAGYTFQLTDFEKAADQHILSVQRDPGADVVYVGFILLFLTLVAVFFFSHQRVWAAIEPTADGNAKVILGGNANRSAGRFTEKFDRFYKCLASSSPDVIGG
jgi:cytochrome c biogenesis protein